MSDAQAEWQLKGSGWELDRVHFDRPVTAFTESVYLEPIETGTKVGFARWSLPMDRYAFTVVNRWAYGRVEPFGGEPPPIINRFPALAHLWKVDPRSRKRILGFEAFVRDEGFEKNLATWDAEWRPEAERRVAPLRNADPSAMADDALADHLDAWMDFLNWAWTFHLNLHIVCFYVRAKFRDVCRDALGLSDFEAYELIKRSDPELLRGSGQLADMARRAKDDEEVAAALALPADQALARLEGTWFAAALATFLEGEGDRSGSFEMADPTWREMPELVVGLVKSIADAEYDPVAEDAEFQAWRTSRIAELRERLDGAERERFDVWLARGELAYPLNETHNGLLVELPFARARYAALETGRRLQAAGRLTEIDDVFHLRVDELTAVLRGEQRPVEALVSQRRADYERALALQPPDAIGAPAPDPPYNALPEHTTQALTALLEQTEQMMGAVLAPAAPGTVAGSPGSPGSGEGPVRIVRSIGEFDRVQAGDVLVCPLTTPAWTVLFPQIAGLVTESGGALSHAAIVAREYGVPSVVGAAGATQVLLEGQRVRVDGDTGAVRVLAADAVA